MYTAPHQKGYTEEEGLARGFLTDWLQVSQTFLFPDHIPLTRSWTCPFNDLELDQVFRHLAEGSGQPKQHQHMSAFTAMSSFLQGHCLYHVLLS